MNELIILACEKHVQKELNQSIYRISQKEALLSETGDNALDIIDKQMPAIAVIDLILPDMDGIELLRKIKSVNSDIEVIIITEVEKIDLAVKGLKLGASDFILKPVREDALEVALERAFSKIAIRREYRELTNAVVHPPAEQVSLQIEEERLATISQFINGVSSFIAKVGDDFGKDTAMRHEMPCFVSIHNREGKVVTTNRLFSARLGNKIGSNSWEIYKGNAAELNDCPVGKTLNTGKKQRSEETVICKDGKERPVIVHSTPIMNKHGDVDLVLEIAADIRGFKDVTEALRETQNKYMQLFNEVPCYIYVIDKEFKVTAINRRFQEDFGAVEGRYCYTVYKRRDAPCPKCPLIGTFKFGKQHQAETIMTAKNNENITAYLWSAPIRNLSGEITHVMVMGTDVTQMRKLQDHLSSLGLMIGSISHGIKGLLTGLDAGLYLLDSGFRKKNREKIKEGRETVKLTAGRIRSLILDILYYAKERDLEWERVDVLSFAKDVEQTMGIKIRSNRIHFRNNFDEFLEEFEVDPGIVHSALINILENAIDACLEDKLKESHTISFNVSQENGHVVFDVLDNGPGMDEETRRNLFNIFFSSKGRKGTGLGLFVSNKIIQQHGGLIEVDSKKGEGTHFRIRLPKILPQRIKNAVSKT